ncbi:hypothetical protein KIPB_008716, partial [Kipferlia bialata]|eukprot:g8716.t1
MLQTSAGLVQAMASMNERLKNLDSEKRFYQETAANATSEAETLRRKLKEERTQREERLGDMNRQHHTENERINKALSMFAEQITALNGDVAFLREANERLRQEKESMHSSMEQRLEEAEAEGERQKNQVVEAQLVSAEARCVRTEEALAEAEASVRKMTALQQSLLETSPVVSRPKRKGKKGRKARPTPKRDQREADMRPTSARSTRSTTSSTTRSASSAGRPPMATKSSR